MKVPIQVASQRSGLSAHVIRIWERRYRALVPNRTGTNRRMYDDDEITRLRLLRKLTERGHRISGIAELSTPQLLALLDEENLSRGTQFTVDASPQLETAEHFVKASMEAATAFESDRLRRLLHRARLQFGQRGMLRLVIAPLIRELGSAWQDGTMRIGQEHLGTSVIREVLLSPVPGSQTAESAGEIIVATPSGEVHELGALLVAASARDLGWRVTYLGPNLPAEEIAACARARNAAIVAISVVYPEGCSLVQQQLTELRKLLPVSIRLMVGGRAARGYQQGIDDPGIDWVDSLSSVDQILGQVRIPR